MSQEYAWPATWRREEERRPAPGRRAAAGAFSDLAPGLVLGSFPQVFDFIVWSVVGLVVIPQVYLADRQPVVGLAVGLAVWASAYGLAWIARRALAFAASRWEPRPRLAAARLLFAGSSLLIALLPGPQPAPWALLLLVLARGGQGIGLAGLAHGRLAPQMPAADERRQRLRAWALAACLGLAGAGVTLGLLGVLLPHGAFLTWGWRYPFVIALALNIPAFVGDLYVEAERQARRGGARPRLRLATVSGVPVETRRG